MNNILIKEFAKVLKLTAMMSVVMVFFVGCSKDEDTKSGLSDISKSIKGTEWTWIGGDLIPIIPIPNIHFITDTTGESMSVPPTYFAYTYDGVNVNIYKNGDAVYFGKMNRMRTTMDFDNGSVIYERIK